MPTGQWLPAVVAVVAGAGLLFGLQSSLTESSIDLIRHHGVGALVLRWQPWLLLAVAIYGAVLIQSAYEMAPRPASFPPLVTVEPLTGLVSGVTVLHGSLHVSDVGLAADRCALELEHLLHETETTVGHYWESARTRVPRLERESHVERAARHVRRLEGLLVDMNRLRGEEDRHLRELPTKERLTLAPLDAELDQRQERIEAWAARLHAAFEPAV